VKDQKLDIAVVLAIKSSDVENSECVKSNII